jgi:hypothetical protein
MTSLQRKIMEIGSIQKVNFFDTSQLPCQEADILEKGEILYLVYSVSTSDFHVLNTQTRKKETLKFSDFDSMNFKILTDKEREEAFKNIIIGFAMDRLSIDACIDFTVKFKNGILDGSKLLAI